MGQDDPWLHCHAGRRTFVRTGQVRGIICAESSIFWWIGHGWGRKRKFTDVPQTFRLEQLEEGSCRQPAGGMGMHRVMCGSGEDVLTVGRVNLQNTESVRQLDIRGWTGGAFLLLGCASGILARSWRVWLLPERGSSGLTKGRCRASPGSPCVQRSCLLARPGARRKHCGVWRERSSLPGPVPLSTGLHSSASDRSFPQPAMPRPERERRGVLRTPDGSTIALPSPYIGFQAHETARARLLLLCWDIWPSPRAVLGENGPGVEGGQPSLVWPLVDAVRQMNKGFTLVVIAAVALTSYSNTWRLRSRQDCVRCQSSEQRREGGRGWLEERWAQRRLCSRRMSVGGLSGILDTKWRKSIRKKNNLFKMLLGWQRRLWMHIDHWAW